MAYDSVWQHEQAIPPRKVQNVKPVSVIIIIEVNQQAILLCSATLDIMSIFFLIIKRFDLIFYIKKVSFSFFLDNNLQNIRRRVVGNVLINLSSSDVFPIML